MTIAISQASTKVQINSSVFWVIMRREVVQTDVSGLPIGSPFNGQAVLEYGTPYVVPKRRFNTTSRRVITKKMEEFGIEFHKICKRWYLKL
jgi:hypothetical protein